MNFFRFIKMNCDQNEKAQVEDRLSKAQVPEHPF
jgi:hypothetical protein